MTDTTLPAADVLERTAEALRAHGFDVVVADDAETAKKEALARVPDGASVACAGSATLNALGITAEINESGRYDAIFPKIMQMDRMTQMDEIRRLSAAPDVELGSVHAVTETGEMVVASGSGSQIGPYAYTAGKVILVVGAQKVVPDVDAGIRRIYDYALPKENERMQAMMGRDSAVRKLLILNEEGIPGRTTVVLVNASLGV